MKLIKNLILYSIITISTLICLWYCQNFPSSDDYFPYSGTTIPSTTTPIDTDFTSIITGSMQETENWLNRLLHLFMPNSDMIGWYENPSVLFYLKTIVNLLLSFVSLIALILIIYAFYMIFFKKDEAGYKDAIQIIKWVVIALFVIGLSRIIVSFLFRFEKENTQNVWYNSNTEIVTSLT